MNLNIYFMNLNIYFMNLKHIEFYILATIDLYENDYKNWLSNNKDPFGIAQRFLCKSDLKSNEKL